MARFLVGHEPVRRAQYGHPEARQHTWNAVVADVDATPGPRDATHTGECGILVAVVLQHDGDLRMLALAFLGLLLAHVRDEALGLQDVGDRLLYLACGHAGRRMPRHRGVANSGQHVGDGISRHLFSPARLRDTGQLALEREAAEAQPAQVEVAIHGPTAATGVAAVVESRRELRGSVQLRPLGCTCHLASY